MNLFLRLASLPENLPKIDFEAYKKQLPNPAAIAALEKGVIAFLSISTFFILINITN